MLLLALSATVAGPAVISLRDLVDLVRSAGGEAGISLSADAGERRALVVALRWMIDHGLASELHAHVDDYATDADADAVLRLRPDRIALVPLPSLAGTDDRAGSSEPELLGRRIRRENTRQWLRGRLVEDPVVYKEDLDEAEWAELRRRLGEESRFLEEMFDLQLEVRAEGVATIDLTGELADQPFPAGGTEGHAALLLIAAMHDRLGEWAPEADIDLAVARLAQEHARYWSKELVAAPERLSRRALDIVVACRLAQRSPVPGQVRFLPAAARFSPAISQTSLW